MTRRLARLGSVMVSLAALFAAGTSPVSADWTTYHLDLGHSGNDTSEPALTSVASAWTYTGSRVYAEPLVAGNTVFVVDESNHVTALDAATGAQLWQVSLGTPVNSSTLPCGNISPTVGITSTPVIDLSANAGDGGLFALAFLANGGSPVHRLFDIDLRTHAVAWSVGADPSTADPTVENQRGSLALANGRIYVPYGGLWGDCGAYNGYVSAFSAANGAAVGTPWESVPDGSGAGLWAASGVAIDAGGNLWATTGNATNVPQFEHQESVVKLAGSDPSQLLGYWAPSDWQSLDTSDTDIGGMGPLVMPNGLVFQAGKNGVGYVLKQSSLGGIGSASFRAQVSTATSDACFGGSAFDGQHIYVPCVDGLYALNLNASQPSFATAWVQGSGANPPIIAGGAVWFTSGNQLFAYYPSGAQAITPITLQQNAAHFGTPSASGGRLFVPLANGVQAFTIGNPGITAQYLGGYSAFGPDASAVSTNESSVYVTGSDHGVWGRNWDGVNWSPWFSVGGISAAAPSAVSCATNREDVFVQGRDRGLWFDSWNGSAWSGWQSLGGVVVGGPDAAAASCSDERVFIRGQDNALWSRSFDGTSWSGWQSLGGVITADPAATVRRVTATYDVFVRGRDSALWYRELSAGTWSGWLGLGGTLNGAPDAASSSSDPLDVYAVGIDNALWRRSWNGTAWVAWRAVGGNWSPDPGAAATASSTSVFERAPDGTIWSYTITTP